MRAADRHPGRSAGPEAARRAVRRRPGGAAEGRHVHARSRQGAGQRRTRAPAASRNLRSDRARPCAAARRRQDPPDRDRGCRGQDRHARRSRRQPVGPQGRELARHHNSVLGAGAEGSLRSRSRARRQRRLDRALLHPAAGRHRGSQEDHPRPRPGDGQDREAAGGDPARGDPRHHRRADGRARRPWRRDAARAGAGHPEIA